MTKNDAPGVYGLLEIKCIYSCRNGGLIHGCKFLDKTGNFLLKGSSYYTQVQLCCWATGASYINLFLYTAHHHKTIHVPLDPNHVQERLEILEMLYFELFLPTLFPTPSDIPILPDIPTLPDDDDDDGNYV